MPANVIVTRVDDTAAEVQVEAVRRTTWCSATTVPVAIRVVNDSITVATEACGGHAF